MKEEEEDQIQLLTSTDDEYSGVIVELMDHPIMDSTTFLSILRPSISNWKQQVVFIITNSIQCNCVSLINLKFHHVLV